MLETNPKERRNVSKKAHFHLRKQNQMKDEKREIEQKNEKCLPLEILDPKNECSDVKRPEKRQTSHCEWLFECYTKIEPASDDKHKYICVVREKEEKQQDNCVWLQNYFMKIAQIHT